jgi:O-antigen ligase
MLALACYIVLQHLLSKKPKAAATCMQAALFLFLSCNMFITAGRAGQVAYCVLMTVALFQYFYHRSKKILVTTLLCIPLLIIGIYHSGTIFKDRIDTAVLETENYTSGEVTSVGCRIWFCKNTMTMIKQNWLIGTGTGDFSLDYAKINHKYSPTMPDTDNPHNQYLLTLSQFGLLGLLSLAAIFYSQFMLAIKTKDALSPLRLAFPIFFLVIMLAESYLQVYGTGFLFSLFSAFLYKDFSKQTTT